MPRVQLFSVLLSVLISTSSYAAGSVVEVYCLDQTTRLSYGVGGNNIKIETGAFIDSVDANGVTQRIDLKKGECELRVSTPPEPYEG